MFFSSPLGGEVVVHPADQRVTLDGDLSDWKTLHGKASFKGSKGASLELSHDQKHLLLAASFPNASHQPLPMEKVWIEIHWEKASKAVVPHLSWEIGVDKHARIQGQNSQQLHAGLRHSMLEQKTYYECAIPLSNLPLNYRGLSISVQFWDEADTDRPTVSWMKQAFRMNEFSKAQEQAADLIEATDFDKLKPDQARKLLQETIPAIGNTASGYRAFARALEKSQWSSKEKARAIAKFIHQNPNNPLMRSLILSLFRSQLGELGWEKSFNVVAAVAKSAKVPRSEVYDGLRGHYYGKVDCVLKGWHAIGPFPFEGAKNLGARLPHELEKITLKETYSFDGTRLSWKNARTGDNYFVDLRQSLDTKKHGKAYAVTWVKSELAQTAALEIESTSPSIIWVNGNLIRTPSKLGDETIIKLNQGWNQILLENDSVTTGKAIDSSIWQFRVSLLHPMAMGRVPHLTDFATSSRLKVPMIVASSLEHHGNHTTANLADGDEKTIFWSNRNAKAGDTVTMTFNKPTLLKYIIIPSGKGNDRDPVTNAVLEYSTDGKTWKQGATFKNHKATMELEQPKKLKGLRVKITKDHETWIVIGDPELR